MSETSLPYPEPDGTRTAGWSGSETSKERAVTEAQNGAARRRQAEVLGYAAVMGRTGVTVADLRDITDLHHGQVSSTLSVLHKEGRLARLTEKRDRCQVYVLPEHVDGREEAPRRARTSEADQIVHRVRRLIEEADKHDVRMVYVDTLRKAVDGNG